MLLLIAQLTALAAVGVGVLARCQRLEGTVSVKRVGSITHWRFGRIGGSFYRAKAAR